eukprot:UC1_evm2s365
MDVAAATATADALIESWCARIPIVDRSRFGSPDSLAYVYCVHEACAAHARCPELGGVVGYKLGGIGVIAGEAAIYAPLFGCGLVEAVAVDAAEVDHATTSKEDGGGGGGEETTSFCSSGSISKSQFGLFGLEAEIGFTMAKDLPPPPPSKEDGGGQPYTEAEVYAAVDTVTISVECCGRRVALEDSTDLDNLADTMSAGGVVKGRSFAADTVTAAQLAAVQATMQHVDAAPDAPLLADGSAAANPCGSPVASLTFCANHLNNRGLFLKKGDFIIAGAMCKTRNWQVSRPVIVSFGDLGAVIVSVQP